MEKCQNISLAGCLCFMAFLKKNKKLKTCKLRSSSSGALAAYIRNLVNIVTKKLSAGYKVRQEF